MVLGKQLTLLLLLFFSAHAYAYELRGPDAGVIPFGMGRAYSAVADDWLALYYNPAGLALVNKGEFQAFDLKLGSNSDTVTHTSNYSNLSDGSVASVLNSFVGQHVRAEAANITQITLPYFALGFDYNVLADVDVQNSAYPRALLHYTKDFSIPVGFASSFGRAKELRIGGKIAFVNRTGGDLDLPLSQITSAKGTVLDQLQNKGNGWSGTLGVQYRLPGTGRTEVNLAWVWNDIGKTSYGSWSSSNRPTRTDDTMTAGMAIRFPIGGRQNRRLERRYGQRRSTNHLTFAFDYSHLNYSVKRENLIKHLHYGLNLDLPVLSLQLGINQSSFTFGASFDVGILKIAAATYAEELGSYGGQHPDRRYLLSIGSSFGTGSLGRH